MQSLLDPAILFFVLGALAGLLKSNLEIPPQISRFLSLYLLMALGLKGGFALAHSGLTQEVSSGLAGAVLLSILIPLVGYAILKRFVSGFDAAAIAATYGSVSAVTFITATQHLDSHNIAYGGHMAAAMALMESPAIMMAILFANSLRKPALAAVHSAGGGAVTLGFLGDHAPNNTPLRKILHESLTDGAQLLLLGAMAVGILTGDAGKVVMKPFSADLFKGMLAFFLLDMGLMAARNLSQIRGKSPLVLAYAILGPIAHSAAALGLAAVLKLQPGDAGLLMVLAASASYIAVPAVLRHAIPEANPSLYFGMSLGITFPINILFGIPVYIKVAQKVLG